MKAREVGRPLRSLALVGIVLGVWLTAVAPASGAGWALRGTFGAPVPPTFGNASALAVDPATGDLLVADSSAGTLSRYHPDGTPSNFAALGTNEIGGLAINSTSRSVQLAVDASCPLHQPPLSGAECAAVDPANGDIYLTEGEHVDVFGSDGALLGQLSEAKEGASASGPLALLVRPRGVAVDLNGAVYVAAAGGLGEGEIHKYLPTANPVTNADNVANFARPASGHVAAGSGPSTGFVFSTNLGERVAKVDSTTGQESYVVDSGESVAVDVDRQNGDLFTASELEFKEYDASGPLQAELVSRLQSGSEIEGMAVDGARQVVYISRSERPTIEVWEAIQVPEVKTLPATGVGQTGATLEGEVNPSSQPLTECFFEFGETASYGRTAPCADPDAAEVGAGSSFVAVHAAVQLEAGTGYHFRLVAGNANTTPGTNIKGSDETLTTAGPQLRGEGVSEVTATSALVRAAIGSNGLGTGFVVEYLSDAAYRANPPSNRFAGAVRAPAGGERSVPAIVSGTGNITAGSPIVKAVKATSGVFAPGQAITGPGIAVGTTIVTLKSPVELKLSKDATETISGMTLSATGVQPVSQLLTGLSPIATYQFRFVARNGAGTLFGSGAQFTTPALPEEGQVSEAGCANAAFRQGFSAPLPDCRAYELVSPSSKLGEVIPLEPQLGSIGGSCQNCRPGATERAQPMQSSLSGEAVLYAGQPFNSGLPGNGNEYRSERGGGGWGTAALSPLATFESWEAFSPDLSRGILGQIEPPLAPTAPTRGSEAFANLYLAAGGSLTPLITEEPPHRDPGGNGDNINRMRVRYDVANAGVPGSGAFTHVLFEANDALTSAIPGLAPAAPEVTDLEHECPESACDLYEWQAGQLRLVNVAPGNAGALGEAAIGSGLLASPGLNATVGPEVQKAISTDGSRAFWTSGETGQLYVRVDGARTILVPGPATCKASVVLAARACFLTASADGSQVLLSNGQIFSSRDQGLATERYELSADLTGGAGGFQGIFGTGEEGGRISRVYFADPAVLPAAPAVGGKTPSESAGRVNLYYWREGTTRFVASLPSSDNVTAKIFGSWQPLPQLRTAQTTSDGRFLAFMSTSPLTGYDNTCSRFVGGETKTVACSEVFEYGAETGTIDCVSCNPSGQRPLGPSNLNLIDPQGTRAPAFRQPTNLSIDGGGRVFFESQDALVPQDTNGRIQDVYEWEPAGKGSCAKTGGCVRLISSGHGSADSMFMDSSADGDDVFLVTSQQLVAPDRNQQLDLYDARVEGGFAEGSQSACSFEACRGPLAVAPEQPSAGTQIFSGPGNPPVPKQTKKKKHKKHNKHKKKQSSKAKKHHAQPGQHNRGGRG